MKRFLSTVLLSILMLGLINTSFGASGYIWLVKKGVTFNPPWCPTIQKAVDEASSGNSIRVYPGTYDESVNFDGKHSISVRPQDLNSRPNISEIIIEDCDNITIEGCDVRDITIDNDDLIGHVEIENCNIGPSIKNNNNAGAIYVTCDAINIESLKFLNCIIDGNGTGKGAAIECNVNAFPNAVNVYFEGNDIVNCVVGVWALKNVGLTAPIILGYNIYMISNNFDNCTYKTHDQTVGFVNWHWSTCRTCPSYYKTPNYPSNYYNNCNEIATIDAPGSNGYYVVVNGMTEYGYDYLYIRELNGSLIKKYSGRKINKKSWISNNRSVKVEFISDYSVIKTGYSVTVQD